MQPESNVNNFTQLGNKHSCQKNYVKLHKPFLKRVCFKETKYGLSYFRLFFFFLSCVLTESILVRKIPCLVK